MIKCENCKKEDIDVLTYDVGYGLFFSLCPKCERYITWLVAKLCQDAREMIFNWIGKGVNHVD